MRSVSARVGACTCRRHRARTHARTIVSLEPRKGVCVRDIERARMHSLSASRLVLISAPSRLRPRYVLSFANVSTPTTCTPIAANERLTGVALDGLTRADTGITGTTSAQLQPLVGCAWKGYGEARVDRPGRGFVRVAALPGLLARVARVGAALAPGEIDERELAEDSTALAAPCAAYSKQRACHACPAEFICSVSVALKVALRGDLSGTEERWRP
jgi:hypothetical protein